jgi:hypothetical protein
MLLLSSGWCLDLGTLVLNSRAWETWETGVIWRLIST